MHDDPDGHDDSTPGDAETPDPGHSSGSDGPGIVAEALYAHFAAGEIDEVLALLAPDVVWELVGPVEIPYFGRYEGVSEVGRFFELLGMHCIVERFEVHNIAETGYGAIAEGLECGRFVGHPDGYEMRWCHVMRISGGRITSFSDYLDTAPMLAAWKS